MNRCDEIRAQMVFYLDAELQGSERSELESHLLGCQPCRVALDTERHFLESIRGCAPLHKASRGLRGNVERLLGAAPLPEAAPPALRERVGQSLWRTAPVGRSSSPGRRFNAVAATLLLAIAVGLWGLIAYDKRPGPNPPSDFALMAIDTHQRHLRGQLPLEIISPAPERVSSWLTGKVPFGVELPNYQESSGQERLYELEGARLVGYKSDYAAFVAYHMQKRPISLLVTSATVAQPSGGEEITSRGLVFHYDSIGGLKVITWSDRGLTYALVSDLEERGQQSCIVCHQGTKDQDFIESLKPQ